jgi:hypothetical protein
MTGDFQWTPKRDFFVFREHENTVEPEAAAIRHTC